jgi:transposase InsO family protein
MIAARRHHTAREIVAKLRQVELLHSQARPTADEAALTTDTIDVLPALFMLHGIPGGIRSDNGPEFVAKAVREWIVAVGAQTAYMEPGALWENGYCETFNVQLRGEPLDGDIFCSLKKASTVSEAWRRHYDTVRPHSALAHRPPAPETMPHSPSPASLPGAAAASPNLAPHQP